MKKIEMKQIENRRMGPGDGWTEWVDSNETADGQPLPPGSVTISGGFRLAKAVIAVKDGRVVGVACAEECTWWDDPTDCSTWAPGEGETLHKMCWGTEPDAVEREFDERAERSLDPEERTAQTYVRSVEDARNMSARFLASIGAYKDAEDRRKAAEDEIRAQKRARYEAARERAELLYPYAGSKVFKAHIQWALETAVSECARVLAPRVKWLRPHLRPLGGWPCHPRMIPSAWHRAYGFSDEEGLGELMDACARLTQPRLDAAWEVACVLAR